MENPTRVMIEGGRLLWPHLYEPKAQKNGDPKYTACIAWDKDDKKTTKRVKAAIAAAEEMFTEKYKKKLPRKYESPLKDGDDEDAPDVMEGMWYMNVSANAKRQPQIFNKKGKDVTDDEKEILYSGCYVHMQVNVAPFNVDTNSGIGVYVNGTMFAEDGEPVGGGGNVAADFAKFSLRGDDDDDDEDEDDEPRKKSKKKVVSKTTSKSKKSRDDDEDEDEDDDDEEEDEKPKPKKKPAAKAAPKGKTKRSSRDDDDEEDEDDEEDDEEDDDEPRKKSTKKPVAKSKAKAREYDDEDEDEDDDEEEEKPKKKGKK